MEKVRILNEIKRIAALNRGTPPGWRRFASETGIKYSDWCGVFWARWSDAVREAGLTPNRLCLRYTEVELLEKLAGLAKETRRVPTNADLRLKAHEDKEFPSHNAFRQLGAQGGMVRKLAEYCRGRSGFEDVVRLCDEYLASLKPKSGADRDAGRAAVAIGEVYLMKYGRGRRYKLGKSNAPRRREYELGLLVPERISIVHVIRTVDPFGIEGYWKKRFASKWVKGEFFDLNPADVAEFKGWRCIV